MLTLAISELENLLIYDKPAVKSGLKKDQEYDRSSYLSCAADTKAGFQKLYQFCFSLAKPECVIFQVVAFPFSSFHTDQGIAEY